MCVQTFEPTLYHNSSLNLARDPIVIGLGNLRRSPLHRLSFQPVETLLSADLNRDCRQRDTPTSLQISLRSSRLRRQSCVRFSCQVTKVQQDSCVPHDGGCDTLLRDADTQRRAHSISAVAARVGGGPPLRRAQAPALRGREDGVPHLPAAVVKKERSFLNVYVLTSICLTAKVVASRGVAPSSLRHHRVKDREK